MLIRRWLLVAAFILLTSPMKSDAQLSRPITHESHVDSAGNKFLQNKATKDSEPMPPIDEEKLTNSQCPQDLELRWQTEVSSSIYATPLITDLDMDGHQEVVVPSFVHYVDVLDGIDGERVPGWPAYHKSSVHTSPLLYDVDRDGVKEIVVATYNGEILFFKPSGEQLYKSRMVVPRLRVKKDWHVGLAPDHVDHSHPDIHDPGLIMDEALRKQRMEESRAFLEGAKNEWDPTGRGARNQTAPAGDAPPLPSKPAPDQQTKQPEAGSNSTGAPGGPAKVAADVAKNASADCGGGTSCEVKKPPLLPEDPAKEAGVNADVAAGLERAGSTASGGTGGFQAVGVGTNSSATTAGAGNAGAANARRRQLLQAQEESSSTKGTGEGQAKEVPSVESDPEAGAVEEEVDSSFQVFRDQEEAGEPGLLDDYQYDYDDYADDNAWSDPDWEEETRKADNTYVGIDAHILCTPVIADIDKDGYDEMVVAVSYFFDQEYYDDPAHKTERPEGIDMTKYIGGGIVVFSLRTLSMKWSTHLDLTTDGTAYKAYIYSAPTVVDLDRDGFLEIVVGTSVGFIYALNSDSKLRKGFPKQMGEIQGQVLAADIDDNNYIELVATDTRGNIAAFSWRGELLWDRHLESLIAQGATAGDVDGDGRTEVVVGTASGLVYVLSGDDGSDVRGFPFRTHGRVMAPISLLNLKREPGARGSLDLALVSFDGYLYIINGQTACADVVDVGETSYSMVLAENIDGGDDLDLLVTTMNGNVFCFQTQAPYHPLKAWPSQAQGRNLLVPRHERVGIFVTPQSREYRDISSASFLVHYDIVDARDVAAASKAAAADPRPTFSVTIWLVLPGLPNGWQRVGQKEYRERTQDFIRIRCPSVRSKAMIVVEMVDENGHYYFDEFAVSFHKHFYRLLKWVLVLPLLAVVAVLMAQRPDDDTPSLPMTRGHEL